MPSCSFAELTRDRPLPFFAVHLVFEALGFQFSRLDHASFGFCIDLLGEEQQFHIISKRIAK